MVGSRRSCRFLPGVCTLTLLAASNSPSNAPPPPADPNAIVVDEGTSMAIALSPDGKTNAFATGWLVL
jgi:hypothetical protein